MFDSRDFDQWAQEYDRMVRDSDERTCYPFAGYRKVLEKIAVKILEKPGASVLDIGFGTGTLASELYDHGCVIYGQDFSESMRLIAQNKMPEAKLYIGDFSEGLAEPLKQREYDFITATYALHHLNEEQKLTLVRALRAQLAYDGILLIGDISFETLADREACRKEAGEEWDEEETYSVIEELRKQLPDLMYEQVSVCGGILSLKKQNR